MKLTAYPLTLRQLQYALAVAETRSFRRAAERCHVSQPALSAQLAQLEAVLGTTPGTRSPPRPGDRGRRGSCCSG